MPDMKNLSFGHVAIQLPDDKQITLGPRETKHLADDHFDSEGVQKALEQGLIAILPRRSAKREEPKSRTN